MAEILENYHEEERESENPPKSDPQKIMRLALEMYSLGLSGGNQANDIALLEPPKRTQSVTETVRVPSADYIAEIIGKGGIKIKHLREKTKTYIKTPNRFEKPEFIITGRKEDVDQAAAEIREAVEHFNVIRSNRYSQCFKPNSLGDAITIKVRVPYKAVGLVVGAGGTTIKKIQQQTHTHIATPSRTGEPIFVVTGLLENVELAKQEIEEHINERTENSQIDRDLDFAANGVEVGDDGQTENSLLGNSSSTSQERAFRALQTLSSMSISMREKVHEYLENLNRSSIGKTHFELYKNSLNSILNSQIVQPEERRIVVNLNELGIDLNKDFRNKKNPEEFKIAAENSSLNPAAAAFTPRAAKIIAPIQSSPNRKGARSSSNHKSPKISAGNGIYIQTKPLAKLRSSRDLRNFPYGLGETQAATGNSGALTTRVPSRLPTSPSPSEDSLITLESGYKTEAGLPQTKNN